MHPKKFPRAKRYSISVTGQTYAQLRSVVTAASVQKFVDSLLVSALDDPETMGRLLRRCRPELQ
jgi:hypothetical protein